MGSHAYNQDPEPPVRWGEVVDVVLKLAFVAVVIWGLCEAQR